MKRKVLVYMAIMLSYTTAFSQTNKTKKNKEIRIQMLPDSWEHQPDQVEFITHRLVPAVRGLNGGAQIFLKDFIFSNGTIEFDVELSEDGFVGINFRIGEERKEMEDFYIRSFWPVNPLKRTTLQYAAVVDGVLLWDLTDDYQAAATVHKNQWNHVKMIINGKQMLVFVNDLEKPALHVPILEGKNNSGGISLKGNAIFSNVVIRHNATGELPAVAGYDPTINDSRYLRSWSVTQPINFAYGRDITQQELPDSTTSWTPLNAEHRALINLSRPFGMTGNGERRLAWVKTTIHSEADQERRLDLGFSDEVWVFINGRPLLIDKNYFGTPSMKEPRGRCSIENASTKLPLQKGDNEILIGIANSFYGWGIIARLDKTDGLSFE